MTLPEIDVARIQQWCRARASQVVRDQVWVEANVAEQHATVMQCRPPWRVDVGLGWTRFPIARLHYTKASKRWSLYWRDRNLRFHAYNLVPPTDTVENCWQRWTVTRPLSSGDKPLRLLPSFPR